MSLKETVLSGNLDVVKSLLRKNRGLDYVNER